MTTSFFDLKPGDQVVLEQAILEMRGRIIVTIDRVTETQIIIGSRRFSRETGLPCKMSFLCEESLRIATPELIAKVEK